MDVLTGQVPADDHEWPQCRAHREVQHRDGKPPWCHQCGWTRGTAAAPPAKHGTPNGGWGTP